MARPIIKKEQASQQSIDFGITFASFANEYTEPQIIEATGI